MPGLERVRFSLRLLSQGALVLSCTPCHFLISSPSTEFTSLCCFITGNPLNCSDTMSRAYMLPHPPLMSCTCDDHISIG